MSKLRKNACNIVISSVLLTMSPLIALTEAASQQEQESLEKSASDPNKEVFLNYSQKELDDAYNQRVWAPNADEIIQSWGARSEQMRKRYELETHRYGPDEAETLDIFRTDRADAPTLVFIHGGAWRAGSKDNFSLLADAFVPYGANVVVLNFDNIPDQRITGMADQIRRAIAWIHESAPEISIDSDKLYISGHSSGGHLAGVMLTTDWSKLGLPADIIKGGLPISGMFDMEPVMLSARSSYVELNNDEAEQMSPIRHIDNIAAPIHLAYGGKESPEFQRHSREFHEALQQSSHPSELIFLPDLNHFEIFNSLAEPEGAIAKAARRMMGLLDESK